MPKEIIEYEYERERVPESKLRDWKDILAVQFGFAFGSSALVWVMKYTGRLTFIELLIAFIIGHIVVGIIFFISGWVGIRERLSTYMLLRSAYGTWGTHILSLLVAFILIGWMAAQTGAIGIALNAALGVNVAWASLIVGLLMTMTSTIGFSALTWLSHISLILFIIASVIGTYKAWHILGGLGPLLSIEVTNPMPMSAAIAGVIGSIVTMGVVSPDITRYCKRLSHWVGAIVASLAIGHIAIPIAGGIMAYAVGSTEVGIVVWELLGWFGIIFMLVAGWTTGDNDIYSASLSLSEVIPKIERWKLSAAAGIIGSIMAALGFVNYIIKWLILLGAIVPPFWGVWMADYWIMPYLGVPRGVVQQLGKRLNISAIIAWILGIIAFYRVPGISYLNGIFVALIAYVILHYASYKANKVLAI